MISKRWAVTIDGIKPLISNVRKRELDAEMKALKKDELAEGEENNWRRKAEVDGDNLVVIPARWIRAMLIVACKKTGMVPHFATTKKQTYTSYVSSFIVNNIGLPLCPLEDVDGLVGLIYFGAYVGAQGAGSRSKVWKVRPMVKEWKGVFEIIDPLGRMRGEELEELMNYGGYIIGIGDARALNYGRFDVTEVKEC